MNGAERMKGISNTWSRGRQFSSSLPEDRYVKVSPQKRSLGLEFGGISFGTTFCHCIQSYCFGIWFSHAQLLQELMLMFVQTLISVGSGK